MKKTRTHPRLFLYLTANYSEVSYSLISYTLSIPLVQGRFPINYGFITGSYLTFRFERLFLDGFIGAHRNHIRILSRTLGIPLVQNWNCLLQRKGSARVANQPYNKRKVTNRFPLVVFLRKKFSRTESCAAFQIWFYPHSLDSQTIVLFSYQLAKRQIA